MFQLQLVEGGRRGRCYPAGRLPCLVGRGAGTQIRLELPGVWERHFTVTLAPREGFIVASEREAILTVNGAPAREPVRLRNGDVIEAGAAKLRFELSPTRQRTLRWLEWAQWSGLVGLSLGQVALVYWLTL